MSRASEPNSLISYQYDVAGG